jgi:hypothetical protein
MYCSYVKKGAVNMDCRWFEGSKEGLAMLLEKRGKAFAVSELIQNAWDAEGVTKVKVTLEPIQNKQQAVLWVEDDSPDGFHDITHAYTLFAPSDKKANPEKRGRFNLGEKLVLACCIDASVTTTTGCVVFARDGKRIRGRRQTYKGSIFQATIKVTREEIVEITKAFFRLLPPEGIVTSFNGNTLVPRKTKHHFTATLATEISDEEGNLRPTRRKTEVEVYQPEDGEVPHLYEMGIPVVPTNDKWHINVQQKIPLNMDRDNVTPAYLRRLRVLVLNEMFDCIDKEDANTWCRDAVADKEASHEAVHASLDLRFGDKRVIFDPTDPEANSLAVSKGYTVIHGRSLSKGEWDNVKKTGAALPAGQVTPSPKPYSDDPNADPVDIILEDKWTEEQRLVCDYTSWLAYRLLQRDVTVTIVNTTNYFAAAYGKGRLDFNLKRLGKAFFIGVAKHNLDAVDRLHDLLIHEFAHEYSTDHLSSKYHEACTKIGAKLTRLALGTTPLIMLERK